MQEFSGRLASHERGGADFVTVGIDGEWIRIWSQGKRLGAWYVQDVKCERVTVFRFTLHLDGVEHTFTPDNPAGFTDALGVVVDLRPTSRFGLADRVRAVRGELVPVAAAAAD